VTRTFRDPGVPSIHLARAPQATMARVLLALLPGIAATTLLSGPGVLWQIALAVTLAMALEAIMLRLRGAALKPALTDLSAPLTAVLFALLLPPTAPWWMNAAGVASAIVVAKHLFGGLGHNRFNPAMVGVAVVVIAFPAEFARGIVAAEAWVVAAYALGGILLLRARVIAWQTPVAVLGTTLLLGLPFWLHDPGSHPSPVAHLLSGALVMAAFFIATDPVSGCSTPRGRLVFGAGVALLMLAIRRWADDPGALAFAVLLMNAAAPLIDRRLRPRWLGERRRGDAPHGPASDVVKDD